MVGNVMEKSMEMAIMAVTTPGADCWSLGVRTGATQRFLTGVKYR